MPSGSFKDRGSAVLANALLKFGVREVVEDSSGNAGASLACYAARAGLDCEVYTPESTSPGKLAQITAHGARLVRVPGSRDDTAQAVQDAAERRFYASHNWQPLFVEGMKTLGWELWEQLGFKAPDALVVAVGLGSSLLGSFYAFRGLVEAGEIDRMPRLYAVQAAATAPIHAAFQAGADDIAGVVPGKSVAEGVATGRPIRRREILQRPARVRRRHGRGLRGGDPGRPARPRRRGAVRRADGRADAGGSAEPAGVRPASGRRDERRDARRQRPQAGIEVKIVNGRIDDERVLMSEAKT